MQFGIEEKRQAVFCVIIRREIAFLFRAIRRPALARVVNPTHDVIVIIFLADFREVGRECAAELAVSFADRVTRQTAARFEEILAVRLVALSLRRYLAVKTVLPEISRHGF